MSKFDKKKEKVDLAFFSEPFELEDDPFESKFGGSPISVFDDCEVPIPQCTNCKNNLIFILQLFNSVQGGKFFYVFACCNSECLSMDWKIYRTRSNLENRSNSPKDKSPSFANESTSLPGWDHWGASSNTPQINFSKTDQNNRNEIFNNKTHLSSNSKPTNNNNSNNDNMSNNTDLKYSSNDQKSSSSTNVTPLASNLTSLSHSSTPSIDTSCLTLPVISSTLTNDKNDKIVSTSSVSVKDASSISCIPFASTSFASASFVNSNWRVDSQENDWGQNVKNEPQIDTNESLQTKLPANLPLNGLFLLGRKGPRWTRR